MELPKTQIQQEKADGISEEFDNQLLYDEDIHDVNENTERCEKDVYDKRDDVVDRSKGEMKEDLQSFAGLKRSFNTMCTTVNNLMSIWKKHAVSTRNALNNLELSKNEKDVKLSSLEYNVKGLTEMVKTLSQENIIEKQNQPSVNKNNVAKSSTILSGDESNKNDDKIAIAVRKELEKLNATSTTSPTKSLADEFKNVVKLINKDSGVKRDYKLNPQMKFEHFL
ncbi:chromosome partition protein Smc-like [Nasonia vitripennis]|uniref:Uncharacterized protein n=1 Tax=Nasonia vitripennis TaxID=7425 RepID=A0A7M7QJ55_NASVI|nr:chromosome partition protein Smc-like [Nasonia vitripennis]XP_031788558.1 chromosome partition protein Smc-like [Nasonia vitripennis]